ncbi:MAG TPA: hypothetical protein VKV74_03860 [Bryobacteraceae bacterium]|nr:hypothetical protein [Bryobacteraceae bacterium]
MGAIVRSIPNWFRERAQTGFLLALAAFFCVFHASVFKAHFGPDEMMNLYGHWHRPLWQTAVAEVRFWSKTVRPMGAIYYLPLYRAFGLNPVPFHAARCAILGVNTVVFFKLAKAVVRSRWASVLAAFPIAYHSTTGNLHYDGAFIYDALCGTFYFWALLYYVRSRRGSGRGGLRAGQTGLFLALYICALDSKEMAVSLPVLVLAYELLFQGRRAKVGPAMAAGAITLVFILGKTIGPGALTHLDAYRPVFRWERFAGANTRFLNTIFYTDLFNSGRVLGLWIALLYAGLRNWGLRKFDPRWLFLLIWAVVTPLPLAFLPDRGGGTLYIVAGGWGMLAALALRAVVRRFARQPVAGLPRRAIMAAGLAGCIAAYWHETARQDRKLTRWYLENGQETQRIIAQMSKLGERPPSHSRVVFLNDPFTGYDMLFIAALVWRDPTIDIHLQRMHALPEAELAQAKYVFDYVDGRFAPVKWPALVKSW